MEITEIRPEEYERAAELWEASVRATHSFEHHGFRLVSRSEHYSTGKQYPILHLAR